MNNPGLTIEVPDAAFGAGWSEPIALPSGRKAQVKPVTGRMLIQAQKLAGRDASALESNCATIAVAARIDGRQLRYEEAQDLVAGDIQALVDEVNRASFLGAKPIEIPASTLAALVEFGFSVEAIERMRLGDIAYWVQATIDLSRARDEAARHPDVPHA
ncbi:MAG TPA: hypothetical protein VMF62_13460 [Acetobacteraceae bacterium]|nr:hypothetical protein [Acetobacteraceae bacterium]